ncbi:MAG: amidohydrolase family protein [Planctomycetota bacterium]
MTNMNRMPSLLILIALALPFAGTLVAQEPAAKSAEAPKDDAAKADDAKKDEKKDRWLHVHNVDVYPVVGPVIRDGEILIKNGVIEAVGQELEVPEAAETLDGQGFRAYPGLVALNGQGLVPAVSGEAAHSADPNGLWTILGLSGGITTVVTGTTAVKLQRETVEDYVLRKDLYMGMSYTSSNPRAKAQLRDELRKVYNYLRRKGDPKKDDDGDDKKDAAKAAGARPAAQANEDAEARKALGSAARYLPLMKGEAIAVFNANDAANIRDICDLVETFGFRAVVRGAIEGWTVAGNMGRAGITAVVAPRTRQDPDDTVSTPNGSTMANAAILHDHGVRVAIASLGANVDLDGSPGRDAVALAYSAGAAVRGGLAERYALEGVTIEAARCMGLDDRVGSIEVGKDADIVIVDGELLHYATHVQWAIVNGRLCYDKQSDQSFLCNIRPREGASADDGNQWWPRRFSEMPDAWSYDPEADWKRRNPEPEPKAEEKPAEKPAEGEAKKDGEAKPAEAPAEAPKSEGATPEKSPAGGGR